MKTVKDNTKNARRPKIPCSPYLRVAEGAHQAESFDPAPARQSLPARCTSCGPEGLEEAVSGRDDQLPYRATLRWNPEAGGHMAETRCAPIWSVDIF